MLNASTRAEKYQHSAANNTSIKRQWEYSVYIYACECHYNVNNMSIYRDDDQKSKKKLRREVGFDGSIR